jgi:prenyltransferase beta subunit
MKRLLLPIVYLACALSVGAQPAAPAPRDPVRIDEKTEAVLKGALKWLASKQAPNGEWAMADQEKQHPVAITAYALIAFLACGHLPNEGEFGKNVSAGVQYLLDKTSAEGYIGNRDDGQYMYGHGIACIALAEIYGATKAPALRPKLERAIKLIVAAQNKDGGWRYKPVAYEADISVTVLQVVALRSAKNGGLNVPQKTIDDAVKYVKKCYRADRGGFAYQPGGEPGFARTAAAIYSLQVCGLYDDPMVKKGSEYLLREYRERGHEYWTYGNFYAAPAQYMQGGETWEKWYGMVKKTLLKSVVTRVDLSNWESQPGERQVGPIWSTSVYTMILAMPYHYIPLYQR